MKPIDFYDSIVIGGGASGFFSALSHKHHHPTDKVCILEKTNKTLQKVKISGGGRCNVSHHCFEADELCLHYPRGNRELRNPFHQFAVAETIQWFAERNIDLVTESDGRMFPKSNQSQTIIDCFQHEINRHHIPVHYNQELRKLHRNDDGWVLECVEHTYQTNKVIIAIGGHFQMRHYEWLSSTGHTIIPPVPSLFSFNIPDSSLKGLEGVSVAETKVSIPAYKLSSTGPLLVTHWGISGPAVLKLSAWAARAIFSDNYNFSFQINFFPEHNTQSFINHLQELRNYQGQTRCLKTQWPTLPARLTQRIFECAEIPPDLCWSNASNKQLENISRAFTSFGMECKGKTTYKDEFVTAGGIPLQEINMKTMESKIAENLFFAGEVMDVDGITGGFNFQHAWTSGWIAGKG